MKNHDNNTITKKSQVIISTVPHISNIRSQLIINIQQNDKRNEYISIIITRKINNEEP